jgi:hypothetical protein
MFKSLYFISAASLGVLVGIEVIVPAGGSIGCNGVTMFAEYILIL